MTDRIYRYGIEDLKRCVSLSDVARLLSVEPRFLSKQIYKTDSSTKYATFEINKKNGSTRKICAPNKNLKFIQSRLSRLLYQCYFDLNGEPKFPRRIISHGFQKRRGLSIYTNAYRHTGRRYVFNSDIEHFFDSFNFGRVRGYFLNNKNFELNERVATVLAQTACFENKLPQGAPSSPIITEFISQALDFKLQTIAQKFRCTYTRYADDITFSTSLQEFPKEIGYFEDDFNAWAIGDRFERAISSSGFKINPKKTRMQIFNQRQAVTNLTVNQKVNVSSYYYKGVRFVAHAMMTKGKAVAPDSIQSGEDLNPHQIWGKICHVSNIKGRDLPEKSLRNYNPRESAPHYMRMMGDFFHYYRIHCADRPIVICEGKTDYIYLKEAIRWNISDKRVAGILVSKAGFPKLGSSKSDHWLIDFLSHSSAANDLLSLGGGGGDLPKFAALHIERLKKFHKNEKQNPVIVIVDNDSQSDGMWAFIKKVTNSKATVDGSAPYYNLSSNLYVVPIPSGGKKDFYIEKLFPDNWIKAKIDGKSFKIIQKKGEKLGPNEFGKGDFASKVIRANRGKVDCSSFFPLLHTLCDIIEKK